MIEIRIHGRGGQGSVTMAELITTAAFYDGKFSQGFPNFGVERRGAPVEAYVRIDDKFIRLRSQVYEPDFVIVQDESLLSGTPVFGGLKNNGLVLINSEKQANEIKPPAKVALKIIPATKIGLEIIGKPIINTIMLGAFAALSGLISFAAVEKAIKERFSGEIAVKNVEAAKRGYELFKK